MTATVDEFKNLAIRALESYRGDDLPRCRAAFRGFSFEEMQQEYGASGMTRQQILDEYVDKSNRIEAAIRWVKDQR